MNKKERRHTAIMPACHCQGLGSAGRFTDIVGYTSLMGSDEDRAFEVLAKNCEIHTKLIEQFNGRLTATSFRVSFAVPDGTEIGGRIASLGGDYVFDLEKFNLYNQ